MAGKVHKSPAVNTVSEGSIVTSLLLCLLVCRIPARCSVNQSHTAGHCSRYIATSASDFGLSVLSNTAISGLRILDSNCTVGMYMSTNVLRAG